MRESSSVVLLCVRLRVSICSLLLSGVLGSSVLGGGRQLCRRRGQEPHRTGGLHARSPKVRGHSAAGGQHAPATRHVEVALRCDTLLLVRHCAAVRGIHLHRVRVRVRGVCLVHVLSVGAVHVHWVALRRIHLRHRARVGVGVPRHGHRGRCHVEWARGEALGKRRHQLRGTRRRAQRGHALGSGAERRALAVTRTVATGIRGVVWVERSGGRGGRNSRSGAMKAPELLEAVLEAELVVQAYGEVLKVRVERVAAGGRAGAGGIQESDDPRGAVVSAHAPAATEHALLRVRALLPAHTRVSHRLADELVEDALELRVREEKIGPELVEVELCERAPPVLQPHVYCSRVRILSVSVQAHALRSRVRDRGSAHIIIIDHATLALTTTYPWREQVVGSESAPPRPHRGVDDAGERDSGESHASGEELPFEALSPASEPDDGLLAPLIRRPC